MKLSRSIREYLDMKSTMGVRFKHGTEVLGRFSKYVGPISLDSIRKRQVLEFLEKSKLSDVTWLIQYRILKSFFQYWTIWGELSSLPLPPPRRFTTVRAFIPYIYSIAELRELLRRASMKRPCRRPSEFDGATFRMLLLFLCGTGVRINEALSLKTEDIDFRHRTAAIHGSLVGRARTIPISPHLCRCLRTYLASSDLDRVGRSYLFARRNGKRIRGIAVTLAFRVIRKKACISRLVDSSRQPRVQDLRRTFAVHCMRLWLRQDKDLRSMLPLLGAYLGHESLTSTEAYLAVTPERFVKPLSSLGPLTEPTAQSNDLEREKL
jgi:integrase